MFSGGREWKHWERMGQTGFIERLLGSGGRSKKAEVSA